MKKDIQIPKVNDVSVAVVKEMGENNTPVYNVYLINQRSELLEKVLVVSRGYATAKKTQQKVETSTLRKSLGNIPGKSVQKIEPIMEDLFGLNNEYWVSFWIGNKMFDKKFVFLSESIKEDYFTKIPLLEKPGVIIE